MGRMIQDSGWRIPDALWEQMVLVLPPRPSYPLGCHNPRVPGRAAMDGIFFVLAEQRRVDRADAFAFIFPVWWWSFPAMLKGWIDRVWSEGWAYTFTPERSKGLLRDRPTVLLGSAATGASTYRKYGYDGAMQVQIETGILGYCGITQCAAYIFHDVDSDAQARRAHLIRARDIGLEFLPRAGAAKGHA
jgi:NAD(P)H dehydrogenase (quinone)